MAMTDRARAAISRILLCTLLSRHGEKKKRNTEEEETFSGPLVHRPQVACGQEGPRMFLQDGWVSGGGAALGVDDFFMINVFFFPLLFLFSQGACISGVGSASEIKQKNRTAATSGWTQLPELIRPTLLRIMDLPIIDSWFIHADVRDRGSPKPYTLNPKPCPSFTHGSFTQTLVTKAKCVCV